MLRVSFFSDFYFYFLPSPLSTLHWQLISRLCFACPSCRSSFAHSGLELEFSLVRLFLWKRQAAARGLLVLVWWYDGFLFAGGGCCCWLWWFISMIIRCLFCRCCEVLRLCCGVSGAVGSGPGSNDATSCLRHYRCSSFHYRSSF